MVENVEIYIRSRITCNQQLNDALPTNFFLKRKEIVTYVIFFLIIGSWVGQSDFFFQKPVFRLY